MDSKNPTCFPIEVVAGNELVVTSDAFVVGEMNLSFWFRKPFRSSRVHILNIKTSTDGEVDETGFRRFRADCKLICPSITKLYISCDDGKPLNKYSRFIESILPKLYADSSFMAITTFRMTTDFDLRVCESIAELLKHRYCNMSKFTVTFSRVADSFEETGMVEGVARIADGIKHNKSLLKFGLDFSLIVERQSWSATQDDFSFSSFLHSAESLIDALEANEYLAEFSLVGMELSCEDQKRIVSCTKRNQEATSRRIRLLLAQNA